MNLSPIFRQRFFDSNGVPLAGGQLYSYVAGTTTPLVTYSGSTGTTNTNPVVLDAYGYADVWLDPTLDYKLILEDSNNKVLWTVDNVSYPTGLTTWNTNATYQAGAIVIDTSGTGMLYVSLVNNNQGNALTDVSAWRVFDGNIRTVSVNTTLLITDNLLRSNSTSGSLTHTLPACSTTPIGKRIAILDVGTGGNSTSVKGNGSDTIQGNNTFASALSEFYVLEVENNGSSWDVRVCSVVPAGSILSAALASNLNLPGKAVQENGNNLVVSNTNATKSLAIIRGMFSVTATSGVISSFGVVNGEGFTVGSETPTVGGFIAFDTAFADVPTVFFQIVAQAGAGSLPSTADPTLIYPYGFAPGPSVSGTQFLLGGQLLDGGTYSFNVSFIAIGQRA